MSADGGVRVSKPRIYLHDDGRYVSIGFEDTQDTLLRITSDGDDGRDMERLASWVSAVRRAIALDRLDATRTSGGGA